MAKLCPNCEKENPSVAKFCMYCNTQLVDVLELSEEDKLRIKNAELREQLELLKLKSELEKKDEGEFNDELGFEDDFEVIAENDFENESLVKQQDFDAEKIVLPEVVQPAQNHEPTLKSKNVDIKLDQKIPSMFAHPFSFKGRIRRAEYCLSFIIFYIGTSICAYLLTINEGFAYFAYFITFYFALAQGSKRCHDHNNPGWFQIIPFYLLWMFFASGDSGINDYGVSPK